MGLDNPIHIAFLLVIVLLVFGAKRLPEMGRSLGSGMRGFKEAISGDSPENASLSLTTSTPVAQGQQPPVAQVPSVTDAQGAYATSTREELSAA
jgi:sec-independent protein translocase protein TatA